MTNTASPTLVGVLVLQTPEKAIPMRTNTLEEDERHKPACNTGGGEGEVGGFVVVVDRLATPTRI